VERRLVRGHRLDRLDLDDTVVLTTAAMSGAAMSGAIALLRSACAFRRQTVETELAEAVIKPLMVGQLRGVDARRAARGARPGHERIMLFGRVVRVDTSVPPGGIPRM